MARTLEPLVSGGGFFEGPRWHDGRWWVSDFYRQQVRTVSPEGEERIELEVPGQPSGLGWLPDGSLVVASMKDHRLLVARPGTDGALVTEELADLTEHCGGHLNDLVVHPDGHVYVGNFGFDLMGGGDPATTVLVRVEPDGSVAVAADDVWFPNGSVITPDATTLIVGESVACRYSAWTIGPDGALSDRRTWAQLAPVPTLSTFMETLPQVTVAPDGCCLDAEGAIWMADAMGARAVRVAEGGEILEVLPAPTGLGIFACALGGEDRRTLLCCCAPDFFEVNRATTREAHLFTTRVEVPGAGWP